MLIGNLINLEYEIQALSLEWPEGELSVINHPNKSPFSGILTRLDEPSTRSPFGAKSKKVIVPIVEAQKALSSLLGMAVNCGTVPQLSVHAQRKKIGIIDNATIHGQDLFVSGFLYGQDFPEEVNFIKKNKALLGMSYEIAKARILNESKDAITVGDFFFTGAAILWKNKAAYQDTSLAASNDEIYVLMTEINNALERQKNMVKTREQLAVERKALETSLASLKAEEDAMMEKAPVSVESMAAMVNDYNGMCKAMEMTSMSQGKTPLTLMGEYCAAQMMPMKKEETMPTDNGMKEMMSMMQAMIDKIGKPEEKKEEKPSNIDAAALITDVTAKMNQMLTDMEAKMTGKMEKLITDMAAKNPGGGLESTRKTVNASASHAFLQKLGAGEDKEWQIHDLDEAMNKANLPAMQRMELKNILLAEGKLKVA